jgi:hypothetical protein
MLLWHGTAPPCCKSDGRQSELPSNDKFPISDNSQALVWCSWRHTKFGDRQAGEEVVCLGKSGNESGNSQRLKRAWMLTRRGSIAGSGECRASDARVKVADARGLLSGGREEVRGLLEVNPGLEAKTIFEYLQRRYAGRFAIRRTHGGHRGIRSQRPDESAERAIRGGNRIRRPRCSAEWVLG